MEEKKYHIEELKIAGDKVCEPSPAYHSEHHQLHRYHGMRLTTLIPILWGVRWSR